MPCSNCGKPDPKREAKSLERRKQATQVREIRERLRAETVARIKARPRGTR
jgi:hypothetical protein